MSDKQVVVPHGKAWAVKVKDGMKLISLHRTQAAALEAAKRLGRKAQPEMAVAAGS